MPHGRRNFLQVRTGGEGYAAWFMNPYILFETALGWCAMAWGPRGIVGVELPAADAAATAARIGRRFPDAVQTAPSLAIAAARDAIVALLRGERRDLSAIALDMAGVPEFDCRVYQAARRIEPGMTVTYGAIAARLDDPMAARQVGRALGRNPFPIVVPCHRVVAAGGKAGGFSAPGGTATKLRLLAIEGARVGRPGARMTA